MTDLPKLMLKPYREGYSFTLGRQTRTTETASGMPRQRKDSVGTVHRLSPTYKCTRSMCQYLMAFLRTYEAQPFLAYLLLDDAEHHWYECRITSDSISVSTRGDQIFSVQIELIIKPRPVNASLDLTIVDIYGMTGGQMDAYFNSLEKLVNEDLPEALGDVDANT